MNIRNTRELKKFASERLSGAGEARRIVMIYAGLALGLAALVTVFNYVLGLRIDQLGGLSNMGTRRILSTVQSVLPMVQSMVSACLNVGFLAAMLRIARGQYVSPRTLRLGFDRFWVLLRCTVIKSLLYVAVVSLSVYLGILIYMMSPLSGEVVELLMPYLTEVSVLDSAIVLEEAVYDQFAAMLWPAYLICGVLLAVVGLPIFYSYRMANHVIIDKPALGAMAALRESKKMLRGNRLALFKLDISMWWYYAALAAATCIGYGDMILARLGVTLPWPEEVSYFVFYALYLTVSFGIYYAMLGRVDVTYGLAYDALKPEEKQDGGVVLGNIFQM